MKLLVTGADGFIGKNLCVQLGERKDVDILPITRASTPQALAEAAAQADFVFHLAGINRPQRDSEFTTGNADFTRSLCAALTATGRKIPVLFTSSTQAARDNAYGTSKRAAEEALQAYTQHTAAPVHILRLPNVFGKWARPNYNSAVATFCHNIAQGLPIEIHDPAALITLVYIDDVIAHFLQLLDGTAATTEVTPQYQISVGELAAQITRFKESRASLITEPVGTGLIRALYATYITYLTPAQFAYDVPRYGDARGVFVEMLKTPDCGQFSFFTAHPGITRGSHYHHTKTEKFLVIQGKARFGFRHLITNETFTLFTGGDKPQIVETIPGWTHDITNVGDSEMIVMLWANEIFDREKPDTYACQV